MTTAVQGWIALVAGLGTAILGILKYFNYRSRRDRAAAVGQSFVETVDALASNDRVKQLAAAILLRRFFDRRTEQGAAGAPYQRESVAVIAALLRATESGQLQKLLADGLAFAPNLRSADLQGCNLERAYLSGERLGRQVDMSDADFFEADLTGASLKGSRAERTVFYHATLKNAVLRNAELVGADFRNADVTDADFRNADLSGARFEGAVLTGANFTDANNPPAAIAQLIGADGIVLAQSTPSYPAGAAP
jgi:uncharacterized protein YjbI with pentapeptide repeats